MNRRTTPSILIYAIYLLAMAMTTALLVFWVLVVQRFDDEINQLISSPLGVEWQHFHWFIQSFGAGLFFLVIVALTYLLAVTLSERRYSRKQEAFLSNVSHELKSPVAAIKLHAQTLEQPDLVPEERTSFVRYIVQETDRVSTLVDNLLESSRILAGKGTLELVPVNLRTFFADYQRAVRGRFDLREIDLRFEVHTRAVVMATGEALQRVMDNLIGNALRFTRAGGEVRCEVRDGPNGPEIVVVDDGVGIPKRELSKIFDRFYQIGRGIYGRSGGTGLGLSIVRSLVEEMRGTIRAVAAERGARFEIQLPRVEAAGGGEAPAASRAADALPRT